MKILLEKVKIYGFDPAAFRVDSFDRKQYNVGLYISKQQWKELDTYILNKEGKSYVSLTRDGEFLFYGKSKQPIPVFDQNKQKIEKPVNEVFLADVSILIDEFQDRDSNKDLIFLPDGEPKMIRYSKCLGIRYVSPVANEAVRVIVQEKYETYEDIFDDDKTASEIQKNNPAPGLAKKEGYASQAPKLEPVTPEEVIYDATIINDDLPF